MFTIKYYSPVLKEIKLQNLGKWMELETIILSKVNQTHKDKCDLFFHLWMLSEFSHKFVSFERPTKDRKSLRDYRKGLSREEGENALV